MAGRTAQYGPGGCRGGGDGRHGGDVVRSDPAVPAVLCGHRVWRNTEYRAATAPGATAQTIRVRFNADTNPGLPWAFAPDQNEVTLALGDEQVAFYHATNKSNRPVTGMALYNVTPEKVGKYFHKTACFCFNKQTLAGNQTMEFPVSYWVDPAIRTDPNTADVKVITLSYTFFHSLEDAEKTGALAKAGPHVGPLSAAELEEKLKAN